MKKKLILIIFILFYFTSQTQNLDFTSAISEYSIVCEYASLISKQKGDSYFMDTFSDKKYKRIFELGYGLGIGYYGMNNFKLNFINSYQLNPNFMMGLGIGMRINKEKTDFFENNKWPNIQKTVIPLFIDLRRKFTEKRVSPFLALDIGGYLGIYGFLDRIKGGFIFNTSGGFTYKISDNHAIIASVSYEMQDIEFIEIGYPQSKYSREKVGSSGIHLGITF
jgi:long-subunit fatty acid transport protein